MYVKFEVFVYLFTVSSFSTFNSPYYHYYYYFIIIIIIIIIILLLLLLLLLLLVERNFYLEKSLIKFRYTPKSMLLTRLIFTFTSNVSA